VIAGLDVGTTGCKVTVYDPDGQHLGRAYADYPVARSAGAHEVEAEAIWDAVTRVLGEAGARWPGIGALGVTSFGESFVLLDAADRPLRPVMLYTDPRGQAECDALCRAVGPDTVARLTRLKPHPMYAAPKLMWTAAHCPDAFVRTARVCLIADYVVSRLTGVRQIDYSLATRTMLFDLEALRWSDVLCAAAGVDPALLPTPVPLGTAAGPIRPEIARNLTSSESVSVVSAGQDQVAAAIGAGVFSDGEAVDGAGTVQCITPVFSAIPDGDALTRDGYAVVPYLDGTYVCYAFSFTGGAAVDWFVTALLGQAPDAAAFARLGGDATREEPTGLLVLPHLAGAATPYMDNGSKGAIVGLTLATTRRDLFAAIMEGVCYEMRLNLDRLRTAGIRVASLRATGGGARSRAWMQMKADVLGVPVTALRSSEASGLGAAMTAGVAMGRFAGPREAADALVAAAETFLPRPEVQRRYDAVYARYAGLYPAVRPLVEEREPSCS